MDDSRVDEDAPAGDPQRLQEAWLDWSRTNLGKDPVRGEAAAAAAREAISSGKGINAAYEAARLAWGPNASSADDTVAAGPESTLGARLVAWQAAGLIDTATAARIKEFEATSRVQERGSGISVSEVVAYIGAVVLVVGVGFLYGTQYQNLGSAGRLAVIGLVAAAGLAAGELVRRAGSSGAARRARAAGWGVAAIATATFFAQGFVDANILTKGSPYGGSPDSSGSVMLGAAIGFLFATALLARAGAGLIAVAAVILVFTAASALDAYVGGQPTEATELTWLVPGALLAALSELIARGYQRRWAREILRFGAVLPPVISALIISGSSGAEDLEWFAAILAVGAFGLAFVRGSAGYAIAGGIGLFVVVNEVGFRHFAQSLGFPIVLIASGVTLFAVAGGLVGMLPRLRRSG